VFAGIIPMSAAGAPGFSLNLSAPSATVAAGGSANLMVSAAAVGGFNGQISLSCSAPAGLTCAFNPSTISPGSSASASTLTISATATAPPGGGGYSVPGMAALLPGLGLFGTLFTTRKRKPLTRKNILGMSVLGLVLLASLFALGCGGGTSNNQPAPPSQVTVTVTGTSGSLSQSSAVTVTVN
jgi:hypothetical protein